MGRLPTGVAPVYTAQIVIMAEPEVAGELRAWAEVTGRFASDLQREVLARGWAVVLPELEAATPKTKRPSRSKIEQWARRLDRSLRSSPAGLRVQRRKARVAVDSKTWPDAGKGPDALSA